MIQSTIIRSELVLNCMTARAAELNLLGRGPVAPKRVLQEAISLEMADVSTPLEGPLRGDAGDTETFSEVFGMCLRMKLLGGSVCRQSSSMVAPWETTTTRSPVNVAIPALAEILNT